LCNEVAHKHPAAAFILTIHYPADAFKWTHSDKPEEAIETYAVSSKPWKLRSRCKLCGVCVASFNTKEPKWSVWGAQMDRDEDGKIKHWDIVKPTHHIFYGTRMLDIEDGLPKWEGYADVSARLG